MLRRRFCILTLAAAGLVLVVLSAVERNPRLLYNPSPSAPIGWYRVVPARTYSVGDLVAAWLPEEAETLASDRGYLPKHTPVIKTIMAVPGDRYCIEHGALWIDENPPLAILSLDSQARAMPVLAGGCRSLETGQYFLISRSAETSFDSRYFGPVGFDALLGKVVLLNSVEDSEASVCPEAGGARGSGAEGKIKEDGATRGVTPCLHIDFYSAMNFPAALQNPEILKDCYRMEPRHFTLVHGSSPCSGP